MAGRKKPLHRLGVTPFPLPSPPPVPTPLQVAGELCRGAWRVAWERRRALLLVLAGLAVVVLLVHLVDRPFMRWLATWRTPGVVDAARLLSLLGELHVAPLGVVLAAWGVAEWRGRIDRRIPLGAAFLAMIVSGVLVQFIKPVFGRPRPHLRVPDQLDWFNAQWDSFPSGHSMHWAALVGALWMLSPRLAAWVAPLAVTVMAARILVPRHYPTDVLAGATLGLICGLCFGQAALELNRRLGRLPPRP
jgi:membrane-associated phospholipid phosphatase